MFEIFSFIADSSLFAKGILLLLLVMSFVTWYVMGYKWWQFKQTKEANYAFETVVAAGGWNQMKSIEQQKLRDRALQSPYYAIYTAAKKEIDDNKAENVILGRDAIKHTMDAVKSTQQHILERFLTLLATSSSSAPYIGLLGTVVGVMTAFLGLGGGGDNTLASVAPGIAESLVATAMGLVVAIPALISHNFFLHTMAQIEEDLDAFIEKWSYRMGTPSA